MKTILPLGVALALAWGPRQEAPPADPAANEVTPVESLWGKEADGWQVQLAVPRRRIAAGTTCLPAVVWIRNNTDAARSLRVLRAPYEPHGEIQVWVKGGGNIVPQETMECLKKHVYEDMPFAARQTRGFHCDVLRQGCATRNLKPLKAGTYTIRMGRGSNEVEVAVVDE